MKGSTHLLFLYLHAICLQWADHEECDERGEDGQSTANPEWAGVAFDTFGSTECVNHRRERPDANESSDLAYCCSGAIELAANGGGSKFGGEQTKAVSGTQFAKGKENPVKDCKSCNLVAQPEGVGWLGEKRLSQTRTECRGHS